jgi:gamma-glutamyltranspeptidase / glutathione hydrolase
VRTGLGTLDSRFQGAEPLPQASLSELAAIGHKLEVRGDFCTSMGGGQVVLQDSSSGVNCGASSPRKDGAAIPEPDPYF